MNFTDDQLNLLQLFVNCCQQNPQILYEPKLAFFKNFMESFGATIPPQQKHENGNGVPQEPMGPEEEDDNSESMETEDEVKVDPEPVETSESEDEPVIDIAPLMTREDEPPLPFVTFDEEQEISDEMWDEASSKSSMANNAAKNGDWTSAIQLYTDAITCNPTLANLYAKRACALLNVDRPLAAISDCDNAFRINPDCRLAFKYRGRARRCILELEEAANDLASACKLDFDEETDAWLREIAQPVNEIKQYRRRKLIRMERKELEARRRRAAQAREEYERQKATEDTEFTQDFSNAGMPGMGSFADIMKDPELMEAMKDPEIMAALIAMQKDPSSMSQYTNNPKVQAFIAKFSKKFGASG